ncbi:MAG: oligopeptide transporter, OPT family [Chlamydiia bacterium]|nr:oligopeptide transporter, OPT family [Chlamydiia bacterium]
MGVANDFKPYIAADRKVKEFTFRATLLGLLFGLFFAVANGYLALKIGTTISASIPAAIMSMALMKILFKNATILENNLVQTIATIGEGLAGGIIFTIPALIILGEAPSIGRIFLLSSLGGILGILFMIPMRRFLIVEEHKVLPYPEGTACATILKAGQGENRGSALMAFWGVLIASLYKICSNVLFLWKEGYTWTAEFFRKTEFSIDGTPALLGVGYIIGPKISSYMMAGGILAWWVIIPLIKVFGLGAVEIYPSTTPIAQMSSEEIWSSYVRYIGVGSMSVGGLLSLGKIVPLIHKTVKVSIKELLGGFKTGAHVARTNQDISLSWLVLGSMAIILTLWLFPSLPINFLTIVLLVVLSFFFTAVTSITVGLVGSTSSPVSGMTLMTLLITCLIFACLGWTERIYLVSALTMGCVACCAICIAGTTAQDLKTGFLLGATPRSQQIAEILGAFIPALALGYVVYILNSAYQIGSHLMPAPQATMLSMIAEGVIGGNLPYTLVGIGIVIGILMAILQIPILAFAIGVYLPLSLSTATMLGALVRLYVNRKSPVEGDQEKGILFAAGFVGGDACIGILIALLTVLGIVPSDAPGILPDWVSLFAFIVLACSLAHFILKKGKRSSSKSSSG